MCVHLGLAEFIEDPAGLGDEAADCGLTVSYHAGAGQAVPGLLIVRSKSNF